MGLILLFFLSFFHLLIGFVWFRFTVSFSHFMWVPLSVLCVDCFAVSLWSLCSRGFIFGDKAWFFAFFVVVGFALSVLRSSCPMRQHWVSGGSTVLRFAVLRVDLKLVVVRLIVVASLVLVCVLGVLGVRFLPIVGRSGFLALCVSALAGAVALAVDIRICCLCRSLSALLRVCEAYEVLCTVDCYVAS